MMWDFRPLAWFLLAMVAVVIALAFTTTVLALGAWGSWCWYVLVGIVIVAAFVGKEPR